MTGGQDPGAPTPDDDPDPSERARALLERAENELAGGSLEHAEELLGEMAGLLHTAEDRSPLIAQALWMAALVSLARGRVEHFARTSSDAVDGFELAGEGATARALAQARAELLDRMEQEHTVRERGASGLLEVLAHQAHNLLARARGETSWAVIDRDREHLGGLIRISAAPDAEEPQPFNQLIRALELDPIEAMILAALIPLCTVPALTEEVHALAGDAADAPGLAAHFLARLLFSQPGAQSAVIAALAPRAPLRRYRIVRVRQPGGPETQRVDLEPAIPWFLRATPLHASPLPPGVTAHDTADLDVDIAPPLAPVVDTLARVLAAPRASLPILGGRPGSGKLSVVLAAAASAGRPVFVVDLDALAEDALVEVLAETVRDAFCHGAVLLLRWQWPRVDELLPEPVRAVMAEPGLRLCLATTPAQARASLALARRTRADVLAIDMPAIDEDQQHLAWRQSLATLAAGRVADSGDQPSDADIQARLCRPGLAIGDIVETIVDAMAQADAHDHPVTADALAARLDDRLLGELEATAEVLVDDGRPLRDRVASARLPAIEDALDRLAAAIEGGQVEHDELGLHARESHRPARLVGALQGADFRVRRGVAAALARRLGRPLARIDVRELMLAGAESALAYLDDTAAVAGRAAAVLLLEHADALIATPANPFGPGIARVLARRPASVLLGVDRPDDLPLALADQVAPSCTIDLTGDLR